MRGRKKGEKKKKGGTSNLNDILGTNSITSSSKKEGYVGGGKGCYAQLSLFCHCHCAHGLVTTKTCTTWYN